MNSSTVYDRAVVDLGPDTWAGSAKGVAPSGERVNSLLAISLAVLVFSLMFEDAAPGAIEPSTLAGGLFLVATLFQPHACFRKPGLAIGMFFLFTFIAIMGALLIVVQYPDEVTKRCLQTVYLVVMAWVLSNLFRNPKLMVVGTASLASSSFLLAALQVTGVVAHRWGSGTGDRLTAFGFHPNQLALNFTLGICALLGLSCMESTRRFMRPVVVWSLIAVIAYAIVQTGSRGGLIALAIAMLSFCFQPGNAKQRLTILFMTMLGASMVTAMVLSNPSTMASIDATVDKGNVAGRDLVFPIAIDLFEERPYFGWGMQENTYELGNRRQEPGIGNKDTHNLWLFVLTATGIAGFVPFMIGLLKTIGGAWRARKSELGVLPFTMVACTMAAAVGLSLLQTKVFWLVMAVGAAAGFYPSLRRRSPWSLE